MTRLAFVAADFILQSERKREWDAGGGCQRAVVARFPAAARKSANCG
jgi:hypothetical protein